MAEDGGLLGGACLEGMMSWIKSCSTEQEQSRCKCMEDTVEGHDLGCETRSV